MWTGADFDRLSWHDCHIWGIELRARNGTDDWLSDLAFDIDYIVEWLCGVDGAAQFRVAPATLVFHGVTDPSIRVLWGPSGHRASLHAISIGHIERTRIADQKVFLDRPYYSFRIACNWPQGGEIAFGAWGFTQTLRGEPTLSGEQILEARRIPQ